VLLRDGRYNRAHFAHWPGVVGTADCELYHPANGGGEGPPQFSRPLPLSLYIKVAKPGSRGIDDWQIAVMLPQVSSPQGRIAVAGIAGVVTVPCSNLQTAPTWIPVPLDAEEHRLDASPDVDLALFRRTAEPIPGLPEDVLTAFRYSDSGGRRLSDQAPLYWGRGYYLVWHTDLEVYWPWGFWREEMKAQGQWRCARVELPAERDEDVERWADEYLEREIEHPPVRLGLALPPILAVLEDDSLLIEADVPVVVGVICEHGSWMPTRLHVRGSGGHVESVRLEEDLNNLIRLEGLRGRVDVTLEGTEEDTASLTLVIGARARDKWPPAARIYTVDAEGGENSAPVFSRAAQELVNAIGAKKADPHGVDVPPGAPWSVRARSGRSPWRTYRTWPPERQEGFLPISPGDPHSNQWVETVQQALSEGDEVWLDFGGFGSQLLFRRLQVDGVIRLPEKLVDRLRWLASLPTVEGDQRIPGTPEAEVLRAVGDRLALGPDAQHRALLDAVARRSRWPVFAAPLLRQAGREVNNLLGRSREDI
jgi:hypothetical protein